MDTNWILAAATFVLAINYIFCSLRLRDLELKTDGMQREIEDNRRELFQEIIDAEDRVKHN